MAAVLLILVSVGLLMVLVDDKIVKGGRLVFDIAVAVTLAALLLGLV